MTPSQNAKPKTFLRQLSIFIAAVFTIGMFFDVNGALCGTEPVDAALGSTVISPRHVSIKDSDLQRTLIAGERGQLRLALQIVNPVDSAGLSLDWHNGQEPAIVRVTAPEASGIRFDGGNGSNQAIVLVDIADADSGTISTVIPYRMASRVRVKTYMLELDVSAPLRASDGRYIRDTGILQMPVRVDTSLGKKLLVLAVLAVAVFLFVIEWVRVDVVAIMIMISLPLLNLLGSKETFTGLSSNAVVAIMGVMIISAGLNKVGLVSRAMKPVITKAGTSPMRLMVFLSSLIAAISSVMQNTGAAVLFLPGIRHACKVMRIPISRILMPIGMCAILGGTMTMIGTSPLILLNDILPEGMEKFGFLELTPIGAGFVIAGIIYFSTAGRYFLNKIAQAHRERADVQDSPAEEQTFSLYHELDGPFELKIPADWQQNKGPEMIETIVDIRRRFNVNIVSLADEACIHEMAPPPETCIRAGLSLCVYGPEASVREFADAYGIKLLDGPVRFKDLFNLAVAGTVEAVVCPRSSLIGTTIREFSFRKIFGVTVLAVYRGGKTYYKGMADVALISGDALLLHSTWEHFHSLQQIHQNFTIITPLEVDIQKPGKSKSAVICFGIALVLMLISSFYFQKLPYNPIPLSVCLLLGALGMVLTRVLSIQDAYKSIDWRTVFLLSGLIPLGMAVDRTGTAEWIARGIVTALGDSVSPLVLIVVLACLSSAFCLVISNVGACTLLVPLGASMASQIGVDPRLAAIVVGLGVSNSFLLPTHQVNALYMGPGGYRTKDYLKIGGAMSLIYIIVLVTMTYAFYL
jgi:di/tricarboxylate transporter